MKNNLPFHQFIAHFLPGFLFYLILFFSFIDWKFYNIINISCNYSIGIFTIIFGVFIILCIITGLIFDAIRNIFEDYLLNKIQPFFAKINWEHIYSLSEEKEKRFNKYYQYYIFDINSMIAILLSFLLSFFFIQDYNIFFIIVAIIVFFILLIDAKSLRKEISENSNKTNV